jgi:hypothetical protein
VICKSCGAEVPWHYIPSPKNKERWKQIATLHKPGCPWVVSMSTEGRAPADVVSEEFIEENGELIDLKAVNSLMERIAGSPGRYTTDMGAAWKLIEKLRDEWTEATAVMKDGEAFTPPFDDSAFFDTLRRDADRRWPWAFLYTTPFSVCLAVLKAKGIEVPHAEAPH